MIAFLRGKVRYTKPPALIVEVGGIGYELDVTTAVSEQARMDEEISLFVQHVQREDGPHLYGFIDLTQRQLFRDLLKVTGIGARTALLILSSMSNSEFVRVIHEENSLALMNLPGIGKKTAGRLLIELKDRMRGYHELIEGNAPAALTGTSAQQDAVLALVALGYAELEAQKLISAVDNSADLPVEAIIRAALHRKLHS